jgi:hypothetical protein
MRLVSAVALCLVVGACDQPTAGPNGYAEAFKAQIHLNETNARVAQLERRVNELEQARSLDERRITELESRPDR